MPIDATPKRFLINLPHGEPFVRAVGRLIINCGSLEWTIYGWIAGLAEDPALLEVSVDLTLGRRIDLAQRLAERRDTTEEQRQKAADAWRKARDVVELRNLVAHGPLAPGWRAGNEQGPPDFIGIPSLRALKTGGAGAVKAVVIEGLERGADEAASVVVTLRELLDEISACPVKDEPSRPEAT
jgi:hypothetical protein